uniref:Uncharacterized protein n=1 Tax=Anopheles stephensi TaxID=30069 RepID=A0A182YKR1_ANOST
MDRRKLNKNNFKADLLHWCAANDWPKEVLKRLQNGDNPYRPNKDGLSPMHAAIAHNARSVVNILLDRYAADVAIVKDHMQHRFLWKAENNCWNKRPILIACTEQEREQVHLLASSCPTAIPFNVQVFVLFLTPYLGSQLVALDVCGSAEKQADVLQCINRLLPNGMLSLNRTDLRTECLTYLQAACLYDREKLIPLLVAHGSRLSATGDGESIPLMTACRTMKMGIVKQLLTKYVNRYDPTVTDSQQRNVFHICLEKNNPKLVDYVLKALISYRKTQFGETESEAFNRIFPYKCEEYSYKTTWSLIRPNLKEQCSQYVVQYRLDLSNRTFLHVKDLLSRKVALDYCFEEIRRNPDILKLSTEDAPEQNVLHQLYRQDHLAFVEEMYELHPAVKPWFETKEAFVILRITLTHRNMEKVTIILEHHSDYLISKPADLEEYAIGQTWFDRSVYREPFALLAAAFPEKLDVINATKSQAAELQRIQSFTDRFYALKKSFNQELESLKADGILLPNLLDDRKRNVLHQAADWDEIELVKNLLACGLDLNQRDGEGNLPIFYVRSVAAFEVLYEATPVDPTITNGKGYNLLHHSSRVSNYNGEAILTKLMELGFDVNQRTLDGNVPLSIATCCSTVRFLLANGAKLELIDGNALVSSGDYLEQNPEVRKTLFDSLYRHSRHEAANFFRKVCHRAINCCARWFLDYGYDIDLELCDEYGYTPLLGLVSYMEEPNLDVIERLLQKGANVNARDKRGQHSLLKLVSGYRSAQWYGHTLKSIELLLDRGADINVQDENGNSALHVAFAGMHLDLVQLLMVRGANRTLKNNANKLPHQMVDKQLQALLAYLG